MLNEILIISDYDSSWNHKVKILEADGTLNDLELSITDNCFFDLVCVLKDYLDHGKFTWTTEEEEYKQYIEEAQVLINDYKNIILCSDGDIQAVKHDIKFKEVMDPKYHVKDIKINLEKVETEE